MPKGKIPVRRSALRGSRWATLPLIIVGSALFITGNIGARTAVVVLPFDHHLIGQLGGAITLVVGLMMLEVSWPDA